MPFSGWGKVGNDLMFGIWSNIRNDKTAKANEDIARKQLELAEKEYYSNLDIMNKNFGLQQEAFNYNKQQTEITRQREDNAFQRRVADYVKAGFSPLAAQGVASSSQAPTLTAPQLDPSGVNQATANRLNAYQNKIATNNQTSQLKLQQQQLKLAQIETITETIAAAQNLRSQAVINERNKIEVDWYKKHGYHDNTLRTILSEILTGVNYKGKSVGQLGTEGINFALDKILNKPENTQVYSTGNKILDFLASKPGKSPSNSETGYKITQNQQTELFDSLKRARNGLLSPVEIDKLRNKLYKYFDSSMGLPYGRWKSLSQKEYENILKQITERLQYVR